MPHDDETIAAVATALGEAGIAIVRVSGPLALAIADRLVRCAAPRPSARPGHTVVHGRVAGAAGDLDECLLLILRAPHTYTREDMIEIQCHGGHVPAQRILRAVLDAGARLAEPGEFTRRAFLNGRLDLLQAEAVLDLIRARSERAAAAALDQLQGGLSAKFSHLYDGLLAIATDLEATLDFPEEDLPHPAIREIPAQVNAITAQINGLLATWDEGHLLRDGALVVISGAPNVGKSTLLNRMLGTDRAIVFHMPGTTRDTIEEAYILDGIPLRLVDTAGLRDSGCEVERHGIDRARRKMSAADMHLYVVDASRDLDPSVRAHLDTLGQTRTVLVLNKIDLGSAVRPHDLPGFTAVETCLLDGRGLPDLRAAIRARIEQGLDLSAPPRAVIAERHRRLLLEARAELDQAAAMLTTGQEGVLVLAAARLRSASELVGTATGRTYEDDLLASIFSRFCIGK